MPVKYKHSQIGYTLLAIVVGVIVILDLIMIIMGAMNTILLLTVLILIVIGFLFSTLTIELDHGLLRASFGPGLIRKTVRLDDVTACQSITYPWYYGYGIRLTPKGWLYNVSGQQAVELTLTSGKRVLFGTDQPEELCRAINTWLS